jgi:two-component sensor histidine kinase
LKYAFPDGRKGEIRIELREYADRTARLLVADNGVGLTADVDWVNTRSLGLRLVRTLAQQLNAKIEVNSSAGMEVRLAFAAAA